MRKYLRISIATFPKMEETDHQVQKPEIDKLLSKTPQDYIHPLTRSNTKTNVKSSEEKQQITHEGIPTG